MTKLSRTLALSSAVALVLGGAAYAGSNNNVYLSQDGNGNSSSIQQGAGPGGNDFGQDGAPALQDGDNNRIVETQAVGGGFSRGNNDVDALLQFGNSNSFGTTYSNNAGDNVIQDVDQLGNNNVLGISRNGSVGGIVGTVLQDGDSNFMSVGQSNLPGQTGDDNEITLLRMLGDNNGWSTQPPGGGGSRYGMVIGQTGDDNWIREATINGSFNNANGVLPGIRIVQVGNGNGRGSLNGGAGASTAVLNGTLSAIDIRQDGNLNDFQVTQGLNTASTNNLVLLTQTGDDNDATLTQAGDFNVADILQVGDDNHVNVSQFDNANSVVAEFHGNNNGVGVMGGAAVSSSLASLVQGDIVQDAGVTGGNSITYTVFGDSNLFAFKQTGNDNTITGTVGVDELTPSSSNQVAVLQNGNNNTSVFSQLGGSNVIGITQ